MWPKLVVAIYKSNFKASFFHSRINKRYNLRKSQNKWGCQEKLINNHRALTYHAQQKYIGFTLKRIRNPKVLFIGDKLLK